MLTFQLVSIAIALLLSVIVITRNPGDRNRWLLLVFSMSVSLWISSNILADMPGDMSLLWNRVVFISALSMGYTGYLLTASMANRLSKILIVVSALFASWSAIILMTPFIVEGVTPRLATGGVAQGVNAVHGPGYLLYVASLLGAGIGLIVFIFRMRRKAKGRLRGQLQIIFGGFIGLLVVGASTGVLLPLLLHTSEPANYSFLSAFIILGAFMYAIVRQKLFDIRLALIRSLGYLLTLTAITVFYGVGIFGIADIFFASNPSSDIGLRAYYVTAALVVAITFQPLRRLFSRLTRRFFFHDAYDTEEVFGRLTAFLVRGVDLHTIVRRAAAILSDATKVEGVHIVVAKNPGRHDELLKSLAKVSEWPIVTDELAAEHSSLADTLYEAHIALVSRLRTPQGLVGYVICGPKIRGDVLTSQDIDLMRVASDELAVAVQNALRFEEISRFNVTLKEEVDDATGQLRESNRKLHKLDEAKDEFISMASHQLRTPLTSVKGYLSMVLEGDSGKISPEQNKLLQEAYDSAQRMVYLIGDFLNVSRLQTGKFVLELAPVNLASLVKEEVAQLQATAARRQITLTYHQPAEFPEVTMDDGKIRQVVMNFIDNAIYYSRPNSTVTIELIAGSKDVSFAVHDTGIGVPVNERHHLFTKFYRAANARKVRPDGTGIGLYMAKKVVTAHGGNIIFETKENRGSTFGFTLPLKKPDAVVRT